MDIKNNRFAWLNGEANKCNYRRVYKIDGCIKYVKKDGDILESREWKKKSLSNEDKKEERRVRN